LQSWIFLAFPGAQLKLAKDRTLMINSEKVLANGLAFSYYKYTIDAEVYQVRALNALEGFLYVNI